MLAMLGESKPAKGLPCVLSISLLGVFSTPQHRTWSPSGEQEPRWMAKTEMRIRVANITGIGGKPVLERNEPHIIGLWHQYRTFSERTHKLHMHRERHQKTWQKTASEGLKALRKFQKLLYAGKTLDLWPCQSKETLLNTLDFQLSHQNKDRMLEVNVVT